MLRSLDEHQCFIEEHYTLLIPNLPQPTADVYHVSNPLRIIGKRYWTRSKGAGLQHTGSGPTYARGDAKVQPYKTKFQQCTHEWKHKVRYARHE